MLPVVEPAQIYEDKAGREILGQMYVFEDRGGRQLCLRPEGTATVQLVAQKLCGKKDVKLWYETRCWRYERPQAGRYREFTQFGVEWLNPRDKQQARSELADLAKSIADNLQIDYEWSDSVSRGLAYYVEDGFEMSVPSLGAQKQVLGGGAYKEGIGFAFGIDRLMLAFPE
jgi:histidyl-tRNA synthetase